MPPTYSEMTFDAINALKERKGSSIQAIKKHITSTYPTLNFTPHQMRSALKQGTESGKFVKVKSSYRLSAEAKRLAPKKVTNKAVAKKPAAKKKTVVAKKPAAKNKTVAKRPAAKNKAVAKKPAAKKKAVATKPAAK